MTSVPGTYFTEEQHEADLEVDNVSAENYSGNDKLNRIGFLYENKKAQYDKALAWYLLAARENHSTAQNNIGVLYYNGDDVPKNHFCTLKWQLKSARQNEYENTPNNIGKYFENGRCVPLDKYKALEWYCHGEDKIHRNRLKNQGYHRSKADKKKTLQQLRQETEAILEAEKKKLEEKQDKTQQEVETLEQLKITYKLVDGGKDAWKDIPILLADGQQHSVTSMNNSIANNENGIFEMKKQTQLLMPDKNTFENQAKRLQLLQQEKTNLELQIKEKKQRDHIIAK